MMDPVQDVTECWESLQGVVKRLPHVLQRMGVAASVDYTIISSLGWNVELHVQIWGGYEAHMGKRGNC